MDKTRNKHSVLSGNKSGGGGASPTITPDNLRSKDTVEVILALCEGPIVGLENGAKSFYVGDTQLQNDNGSFNFKAFELKVFPGDSLAEEIIPVLGARGISNNSSVGVVLAQNVPVVRQTRTRGLDFIEVRIQFNRLLKSNDQGTFNHKVNFRIEYKKSSDTTWEKAFGQDLSITGKTSSAYVKEFLIEVPSTDTEDWDVRVTKLSPESTDQLFTDISWEGMQETISGKRRFNNTALIHLVAEASDQFSSIPAWSGIYKGMMIRLPSNYDPETREYFGMWDGTFQVAWSDNPAWIVYDFVMSERYGIGHIYPNVNLDKYDVYEAAQWCDEPVDDGKGGFEPRYTMNLLVSEPRNGLELARYMAGAFNATFFDDLNGSAVLRVDKDDGACQIFTEENVVDGRFEYGYTDITSRYNDITVTFVNKDLNWEEDRRRVFSQTYIDKNGRVPLDFIAVGCIHEREALRRAQYKLLTSNRETCLVNFQTNRLGQFLNPFNVILISDPDQGYGISGRLKEVQNSGSKLLLRDPVYLEAGIPYVINITLSNGGLFTTTFVSQTAGYNKELNLDTPVDPSYVPNQTVFTLQHPTLIGLPRPFRVIKVEEVDGSPDLYAIQAINIDRNKWYDSDNLVDSGEIQYGVLPDPLNPPGPTSVTFEERYVKDAREFQLIVNPVFPRHQYKYYTNDHTFEVWSRLKGSDEGFTQQTVVWGDTIINHPPGLHEFKILGKSYLGSVTNLETAPIYEFNITNPKDPPMDIEWARINSKEVFWGYSNPPNDFAGFQVRYHNEEGRTTWIDAIRPHQGLLSKTAFYTNLIPPSARVIMIKALDDFGVESENAAIIYRALGDISTVNIVETISYGTGSPPWAGTITGGVVEDGELRAEDQGDLLYSGNPNALMYDGGDFYEAVYAELTYEDVFTVDTNGFLVIDIDFLGSGYEVKFREAGDVNWEPVPDRMEIEAGDYEIQLHVFGGKQRGIVKKFNLLIDVDDVFEELFDFTVAVQAPVRLPITRTFNQIRMVNVIIQDTGLSTAVGYRVIDKDATLGPQIVLLDKDNNPTSGLIDVQIRGY